MKILKLTTLLLFSLLFLFSCSPQQSGSTGDTLGDVEQPSEYDIYQQTFVMAMLSNMSGSKINKKGKISLQKSEQVFAKNIQNAFTKTTSTPQMKYKGSDWKITWGPVAYVDTMDYKYSNDSTFAASTQAMFVANNGNAYIVAIAGTNSNSKYDLLEDMDIATIKKIHYKGKTYLDPIKAHWPYLKHDLFLRKKVKVTPGTVLALEILLAKMESKGKTLVDYLNTLKSTDTVTITGHSLGGGLTPPMGVALFHPKTTLTGAGNLHSIPHRIYPLAAPDVGTKSFVKILQEKALFPTKNNSNKGSKQWNQKIWNSIDVVPHAWSKSNMDDIINIYDKKTPNPAFLLQLIDTLIKAGDSVNPYTTMDPNADGQFPGTFKKPSEISSYNCSSCTSNASIKDTICPYFTEILYQHIPAYFEHFKIDTSVMKAPYINPCKASEGFLPKKKKK